MDTPTEEYLQKMPYSELKKYAKKKGIKGSKKTKNLIASILESANSAEDSFVALEQKILNSSKKNKIEKFEKDKSTPSDTPRRETYTIDDPLDVSLALNNDLVIASASPALKTTPAEHDDSLNVTMTCGSEKKFKKRKVSFVTPIRRSARLSHLTPHFVSVKDRPKTPIAPRMSSNLKKESPFPKEKMFRGSLYITNSARKSSEGGRRPSTPMPNPKPKKMKLSSIETPTATPEKDVVLPKQMQINELSPGLLETTTTTTPVATKEPSTVVPKQKQFNKLTPAPTLKSALTPAMLSITKVKRSSPRNSAVKRGVPLINPKSKTVFTPKSANKQAVNTPTSMSTTKLKKSSTPLSGIRSGAAINGKNPNVTPMSGIRSGAAINGKNPNVTPKSLVRTTPLQLSSAKAKRNTPNFNKLHQKQFDKMESIDEYVKRKQQNSSKKLKELQRIDETLKANSSKQMALKNSRIPKKFHGIPFIPTITSARDIKTNFGFSTSKRNLTPGKRLPAVKFGLHNESAVSKKKIRGGAKKAKPVLQENTPLQKKFDLKASLSKKLKYKPHMGPLKPLGQINMNTSIFSSASQPLKATTENKVIKAKRIETRGILHGVRKNKRFELQMKNRNVVKP